MRTDRSRDRAAPVAIGGLGGSGTRVIARIAQDLRLYLGSDLNDSEDNLWFTLLMKRPRSLRRRSQDRSRRIHKALDVFEHAMAGDRLGVKEMATLGGAAIEAGLFGHDHLGRGRGISWPARRVRTLMQARPPASTKYLGWGWKEPNTHIFLPELVERYRRLRYIHVIRHGYEVACGRNQAQLYNWGWLFDVPTPSDHHSEPNSSLRYWGRANLRAITFAKKNLGERFLLINYRLMPRPRAPHRRAWRVSGHRYSSQASSPARHASRLSAVAVASRAVPGLRVRRLGSSTCHSSASTHTCGRSEHPRVPTLREGERIERRQGLDDYTSSESQKPSAARGPSAFKIGGRLLYMADARRPSTSEAEGSWPVAVVWRSGTLYVREPCGGVFGEDRVGYRLRGSRGLHASFCG
jgi:hypothetical protein